MSQSPTDDDDAFLGKRARHPGSANEAGPRKLLAQHPGHLTHLVFQAPPSLVPRLPADATAPALATHSPGRRAETAATEPTDKNRVPIHTVTRSEHPRLMTIFFFRQTPRARRGFVTAPLGAGHTPPVHASRSAGKPQKGGRGPRPTGGSTTSRRPPPYKATAGGQPRRSPGRPRGRPGPRRDRPQRRPPTAALKCDRGHGPLSRLMDWVTVTGGWPP